MLKKKKLKIENLKIESFTAQKLNEVKGGGKTIIEGLPSITSDSSHVCCVQNDNT